MIIYLEILSPIRRHRTIPHDLFFDTKVGPVLEAVNTSESAPAAAAEGQGNGQPQPPQTFDTNREAQPSSGMRTDFYMQDKVNAFSDITAIA